MNFLGWWPMQGKVFVEEASSELQAQSSDLFGLFFDQLALVICVCYPIWRSYKVVEAKKFDDELICWLTYWVLHALVTRSEDALLSCANLFGGVPAAGRLAHAITFYKIAKLLFVMWMIHPKY